MQLTPRRIMAHEAEQARKYCEEYQQWPAEKQKNEEGKFKGQTRMLKRYAGQDQQKPFLMELHVLRIGDLAMATNPFELYIDYASRLKARSNARQTFIVQLACNAGGYLPTLRAVQGGGYGAEPFSNQVGPEGGQELVEQCLALINQLWKNK